ncbi:hypothetical protein GCM10028791_34770 [Echinicola sediminis]
MPIKSEPNHGMTSSHAMFFSIKGDIIFGPVNFEFLRTDARISTVKILTGKPFVLDRKGSIGDFGLLYHA